MSYATPDELAAALRVAVTSKNSDLLDKSVLAASREIDGELDRPTGSPPLDPADLALCYAVCIGRGVEHYKANDSVFGMVGFADAGVLAAPRDTFARWALVLSPLKVQFGVA